jgi:hypothetical protein
MKRSLLPLAVVSLLPLLAPPAGAAAPAVPDAIRLQAGCFQVSYRFLEAGRPGGEPTTVKEWIALEAKDQGPVTLTHVGLFGGQPTWYFQDVWSQRPDGAWRLEVMGRNGPRYRCEGKFVDNRLHCKAPGAAKPMRDQKRTDYDKLDRGISLLVGPKLWAVQEYNDKMKNDGTLVAVEVGLVEYQRLADNDCAVAHKLYPSSAR